MYKNKSRTSSNLLVFENDETIDEGYSTHFQWKSVIHVFNTLVNV